MNNYRIEACITGYVIRQDQGSGMMSKDWAFTTAEEVADKMLELMKAKEAKDAAN